MPGADFSENFNLEQAFQTIPEKIHEELITAMLAKPFDEAKSEELLDRMTAVTSDSKWSDLLGGVHRILGEDFVSELVKQNAQPELVAFAAGKCVCRNGTVRTCGTCPP